MSKAEDLAKELYPDWEMTGVPHVDCQEESMIRIQRVAYVKGYHQAEQDLELSWEDIRDILKIYDAFTWKKEWVKQKTLADGYQEILKRFKETRNERHV